MPNIAISAIGLEKWFGEGEAKTIAVKDTNLEAYFGEILFIVGPSGSGKTTLLSMISGILRPNSGTVTVKGVNIWNLSNDKLAEFRLNTIGFVFQDYHLFPRLTTAENVAIPLILKQNDWDESITEAKKYLEIVGLKGRGEILPVKLSGGEQQRVVIGRALLNDPDIILADEPTGNLDPETSEGILKLLTDISKTGRAVVVATHNYTLLKKFSARTIKCDGGKLIEVNEDEEIELL